MANMFIKREVCPTLQWRENHHLLQRSADEECQTLVCPSCQGRGEQVTYNTPAILMAVGAVVAAVVIAVIACNFAA